MHNHSLKIIMCIIEPLVSTGHREQLLVGLEGPKMKLSEGADQRTGSSSLKRSLKPPSSTGRPLAVGRLATLAWILCGQLAERWPGERCG